MNKFYFVFVSLFLSFSIQTFSQKISFYPSNWWIGMKWNKVQILVYNDAESIKQATVEINYPGVILTKINRLQNEKYLALDVTILPTAKAGSASFILKYKNKTETILFPLESKKSGNGKKYAFLASSRPS